MSVIIYTENWEGHFKKKTFELVSYAAALAKEKSLQVIAVSIGNVDEEKLKELGRYGANRVIHFQTEQPGLDNKVYASHLANVAKEHEATMLLFADNNTGKALAPRLAARMKAGYLSGITGLPESFEPMVFTVKTFSGKAFGKVSLKTEKAVLLLQTNAFGVIENPVEAQVEMRTWDGSGATTVVKSVDKAGDKVVLTDAEIIVSGGRGMGSADNWSGLEEMAGLLGAGLGCSRPVSDEGWRPHEEHVGQTGKVVAPNVYFAFGISGAIQHIAGVSGSKYIVAVNKDEEAPVFNVADFGIVGDVNEVIPKMNEAIKSLRTK
jgi:electron transfer flavoprotein alpha subunit